VTAVRLGVAYTYPVSAAALAQDAVATLCSAARERADAAILAALPDVSGLPACLPACLSACTLAQHTWLACGCSAWALS
jgi:hypothetical protein